MPLSYIAIPRLEVLVGNGTFPRMLSTVRECGYDGIEVNMTPASLDQVDRLQTWVADQGLSVPSFLTGEACADGLYLTSPDAPVRRKAVDHLLRCVEAARTLGSIFVVGQMQGTERQESDREAAQERIVECLSRVAEAAEKCGVHFVIEPVNHLQVGFNNSVAEVLRLVDRIHSPAVHPMVDTIHMNIEERSMADSIRACGSGLRHVHLCESNGGRFGTGCVDFARVLETLHGMGYRHFCSVKVYRQLEWEEAARSCRAWLQKVAETLTA